MTARTSAGMSTRPHDKPRRNAVLLLAEGPQLSLQALYCLHEMGARVDVVGPPLARRLRWSRYCSRFHLFDFHPRRNSLDEIQSRLSEIIQERTIDVVVPVAQLSMSVLRRLQGSLRTACFPVPDETAIGVLNDKWALYELCVRLGVPTPRSVLLQSKTKIDPHTLKDSVGYPLVIKPTRQGGHSGVAICRTPDELIARVLRNDTYKFEPLMAQEFVQGQEIDLNVLARDGKIISRSVQHYDGKTFIFEGNAQLEDSGRKLAEATGYSGIAHFDAIRDPQSGDVKLFDCNPRVSASICASAFCGLNLLAGGIALARGKPWTAPEIERGSTFLAPSYALLSLLGLNRAKRPFSEATWRGLGCAIADAPAFFGEYVAKLAGR